MPVVRPKDAAAAIISAQRKNLEEVSIPRHLIPAMKILKLLPKSAGKKDSKVYESIIKTNFLISRHSCYGFFRSFC